MLTKLLLLTLSLLLVAHAAHYVPHYSSFAHTNVTGGAPRAEKIEVFMIAHSHDDVGWIYPVQRYYRQLTRYIIDSYVTSLYDNVERKFTQVEIGFFQMYWDECTELKKNMIRTIIQRGQLEFCLGGITMNDESSTTYYEEVNQMTEGALWLKEHLNVTAKSAWHVDPFGHSAATASLWSQIGFSGFGLNRIPYWIKNQMIASKSLEFVWRGSNSLGKTSEIFAHVLESFYITPSQFSFNDNDGWNGVYVEDDPSLPDYNVKTIADTFVQIMYQRSAWYRHNKLLVPFGNDFAHAQAYDSLTNMDKLIKYVNQNSDRYNVVVKYAHISDYVNAVNALKLDWPVFEGDFFPYNDGPNSFWSGYFTSRPWKKQYMREVDAKLASAEALLAFSSSSTTAAVKQIENARSATTICTHHDAVSGTETDLTSKDYDRRLREGDANLNLAISQLLATKTAVEAAPTAAGTHYYVVYNQLGWAREQYVTVFTNDSVTSVVYNGASVAFQVNRVPAYSKVNAAYRLYFLVQMPPLSSRTYSVNYNAAVERRTERAPVAVNPFLSLAFDKQSGFLSSVTVKSDNTTVKAKMSLIEYRSLNNTGGLQASGAYIFRPDTQSIMGVGSSNSQTSTAAFKFAQPKNGNMILLTSMDSSTQYHDSIVASPFNVNSAGFQLAVTRLDAAGGWAQNPTNSFLAFTTQFPYRNMFSSLSFATGSQTVSGTFVTIKFANAADRRGTFKSIPAVVVTPRSVGQKVLSATVVSVDVDGFVVQVTDTKGNSFVGASVDYLATEVGTFRGGDNNKETLQAAKVSFTVGNQAPATTVVVVPHSIGYQDPLVLVSTQSSNNFGLTVIDKQRDRFTVVIARLSGTSSGPVTMSYILLPRPNAIEEPVAQSVQNTVLDGQCVTEIQQFSKENYGQTIVQYKLNSIMGRVVEIVSEVGPLGVGGRELITRLETSMESNGQFYTDDNGLEVMKREYNATTAEPVAGNYYPMVQRAFIRDVNSGLQLNLLGDSAHGASSLHNGQLEVMLHRRCSTDDGRGVGEPLNDQTSIRPALWLTLSKTAEATESHRILSTLQQFPPTVVKVAAPGKDYNLGMKELPSNVHLMTVRRISDGKLIVRLQHLFAVGEHPTLSGPVKIDLSTLLGSSVKVSAITEMNLSATTVASEVNKLSWSTPSDNSGQKPIPVANNILVIQPMEIRTFVFSV